MGMLDIIYLTLVCIAVIAGFLFAIWAFSNIREQSIKLFKQRQSDNSKIIAANNPDMVHVNYGVSGASAAKRSS